MDVDAAVAALSQVVKLLRPASEDNFRSAEKRLGTRIPPELAAFYIRGDGTADSTPVENGFTRFWPIAEWRSVSALGYGNLYTDVEHAIVVADYCQDSWWFAVGEDGSVYIVDGLRPARVVASNFFQFVSMLLEGSAELGPRTGKAG